jgi:ribosomal protein S18 acetylase RimI-like enzyme
VTSESAVDPPRPATAAPFDDLLELLQTVRRELILRGEDFTGNWVEPAAHDLKEGRQSGWYYPPLSASGGIAFGNTRGARGWGHVHDGNEAGARALAAALREGLATTCGTVSLGFTGLTVEAEGRVLASLLEHPGSMIIERYAMVRALRPDDAAAPTDPPAPLERVPVRDVTVAALADLDWRSFVGSTDDLLVGGSVDEYARILTGLLANGLGPFLDAASTALLERSPDRVVGGILTAEVTAREAVFLDIMVDPERRHRGLGRFLIRWAQRALRGLGYEQVRLWVTASNTAALRLYETEGFRRVATTRIYRWERPSDGPQPQRSR